MKNNITLKKFIHYLLPSMLSMMLVAIYTFTDTFVVGRKLGSIPLGAMGICTPIITITFALGFLFGMGGGALYSINMGKGDKQKANIIFSTAIFTMLCLGIILAILSNIFITEFAKFLGADNINISYVISYMRCILIFIPGFMLDIFIMCFMKNDGHPNVAMISTVIGTSLNIILDFLFLFVFNWGMFGAAFATCIGSGICSIINISFCIKKKLNIIINIKNIKLSYITNILKTGLSVFVLEASSGIVTFVFINRAVNLYGTIGSSIYTIIMNWTLICFNLIMGISQAVQPLISESFGQENYKNVQTYRKYALISSIIAGALFLIIGYSFTESLVIVFSKEDYEVVTLTVYALRYYLPAYGIMGIGISTGIYYQSIDSSLRSLIIMLSRGILLPVIGAITFSALFGKIGLWLSIPVSELITSVMATSIFLIDNKKAKNNYKLKTQISNNIN